MHFNFFIVLMCFGKHVSAQFGTTTATYEIDLPGSDPVKIIEGEPLWREHATTTTEPSSQFNHRSLNIYPTDKTKINSNNPDDDDTDESGSDLRTGSLKEFLDSYAEKLRKNKKPFQQNEDEEQDYEESTKEPVSEDEKSKSWDLLNVQKHHHPYEDKSGWVSLEPIPWSISKISKWQSNYKNKRPFNDYIDEKYEKPWDNRFNLPYEDQKPHYSQYQRPNYESDDSIEVPYKTNNKIGIRDRNDVFYINRPNIKPTFSKPSATYSQTVHVQTSDYMRQPDRNSNKRPYNSHKNYNNYNNYKHDENCKHHSGDIITDGLAPNFPSSAPVEISRRQGTEMHPDTHPSNGHGEWVLLSTTKGYKYSPSRQRSLRLDPNQIGAHRGVRLTVLPPLKNSKVNMTTSHGGLLQVESTFQTVEQAHREYTKKQKTKHKNKKKPQKVSKPTKQPNRRPNRIRKPMNTSNNGNKRPYNYNSKPSKQIVPSTITTTNRRNSESPDSSAVLAAVGAGMIPATMAMLVPIALNGRRKRDAPFGTERPPGIIEVTLSEKM